VSATETTRWLDLARTPPIPNLRVRAFADDTDYARLSELFIAANVFDTVPWLPTAQNLKVEIGEADGVTPVDDIVIVELEDRVVAAAGVERVVRAGEPMYEVWGSVDPGFRRRGIGTWLMRWNVDRALHRAQREDPGVDVALGSFAEQVETGHRALLAASGFAPVRHFFLMRHGALDTVEDLPLPDGIELRPVTDDQHRVIVAAENEAFRDHWGHREMTESDVRATFGRAELDTDLWVVAWDGDEVAGVVQNWVWPEENARLGVQRGWLEHISVRRPWRRRGLARAITARSLIKLREAGLDEAMLGVDSENPNGALGLYEGLGFAVYSRGAAYRRPLEDDAAVS
jgi:mycothiol synthase